MEEQKQAQNTQIATDNDEEQPIEPTLKDDDFEVGASSVQPSEHATQLGKVVTLCTFDTVTKYTVKELVFNPDCFEVLDESGNGAYTIKGKVIDRSGAKTLFAKDSDERLFKMTENLNTFLQVMYMFDYRSKSVYTMRKKGFFPGFGRGTVLAWKGKGTNGSPIIEMNTSGGRSQISVVDVDTRKEIARMKRSMFGPRRLLTGAIFNESLLTRALMFLSCSCFASVPMNSTLTSTDNCQHSIWCQSLLTLVVLHGIARSFG